MLPASNLSVFGVYFVSALVWTRVVMKDIVFPLKSLGKVSFILFRESVGKVFFALLKHILCKWYSTVWRTETPHETRHATVPVFLLN